MAGALSGVRVIELAGIGPGPYACMLLADMGADVIRVDRLEENPLSPRDQSRNVVNRGRRSLIVDLKQAAGREVVMRLVERADILVEGYRPGVAERLGMGPEDCLARNPALVYGRVTGWGQTGPLAPYAGHDINYISLTGALWATGRLPDKPVPPLNLVGDYAGGSMFLVFGILCALLESRSSGMGQVVDAAMVDGVASLTTMFTSLRAMGIWSDERGANMLDTGYPHYEVYECADGKFVSVGALEPKFYAELVRRTGFVEPADDRHDPAGFAERKRRWERLFRTRSRDEWVAIAGESDACLAPVLDWTEASDHPHLKARETYVEVDGITQPGLAPRLSRTPGEVRQPPPMPGADTDAILAELLLDEAAIAGLRAAGAVA